MARFGGLKKYDAPLSIQHDTGYVSFKRGQMNCPYSSNTMQAREWMRGFNKAYFEQQARVS